MTTSHVEQLRVLKQIVFKLFILLVFFVPFVDRVSRGLLLESLEDCLIFNSDFDQFSLPFISVQTCNFKTLYTHQNKCYEEGTNY